MTALFISLSCIIRQKEIKGHPILRSVNSLIRLQRKREIHNRNCLTGKGQCRTGRFGEIPPKLSAGQEAWRFQTVQGTWPAMPHFRKNIGFLSTSVRFYAIISVRLQRRRLFPWRISRKRPNAVWPCWPMCEPIDEHHAKTFRNSSSPA